MRIEHDLFNSKNYARLQCFCPLQSDGKERTGQVLCERPDQQRDEPQPVCQGTVGQMLSTWKKREYIELVGTELPRDQWNRQQYAKTDKYLKKLVKN